jgi:uncharacterized ferritin-like protein (DUF455 family)
MELRQFALDVFLLSSSEEKLQLLGDYKESPLAWSPDPRGRFHPEQGRPGRPERPRLVPPTQVAKRSHHTLEGRCALMHAICHIEFNAIALALDAVWRFADMPLTYYRQWMQVAVEEAFHFHLVQQQLQRMGSDYGAYDAHDGLWAMCEQTQDDITARMALVPRTLEARGLDATPIIQQKLRQVQAEDARESLGILDIILRDEIGHVAIGNHWYRWLCARQSLDPLLHFQTLQRRHDAPLPKPPINRAAREQAGFTSMELDQMMSPPGKNTTGR